MMEHTPGPWTIQQSPHHGLFVQVVSPSYRKECDANHVVCELRLWQKPEPAANASLIAAAPELLEQCKYLLENAEDAGWTEFMLVDARAAIAKAEGRAVA